MTRGPATLVWVGLIGATLGACTNTRLPECDVYVATIERLASCPGLDATARGTLATSALTIRRAIAAARSVDDGTAAVGQALGQMRSTCRVGTERLQAEFGLRVPGCIGAD